MTLSAMEYLHTDEEEQIPVDITVLTLSSTSHHTANLFLPLPSSFRFFSISQLYEALLIDAIKVPIRLHLTCTARADIVFMPPRAW